MSGKLIVHTEASIGWGGQEMRVLTEMRYMRSRGFDTMLIAPSASQIYAKAKAEGFAVEAVRFAKSSQLGDFFKLWGLFAKHKPWVVGAHSNIDGRVALMAAKAAGVAVKLRYRHVSVPVRPSWYNRFLYRNFADQIITTGDCISKPLVKDLGLDAACVHTIATGITLPEVMPSRAEAHTRLCVQLGVPQTTKFIGQVAVIRSWKGYQDLMTAFDKLAEEFGDLHLVMVGGGDSLEHYKGLALTHPAAARMHFVGHQTQVFDYFRAFEVAVLASTKNEGIPQSLLQAMWAQTPVVGTTVGGIPEVVLEGQTGLTCAPENPAALAGVIRQTLMDKAATATRVATAYKRVQAQHTIEAMGLAVEAVMAGVE